MKIAMISGSPKATESASMYLLSQLETLLQGDEITIVPADTIMRMKDEAERKKYILELVETDAVILSFPLYFDGIPSNLLLFMQEAEKVICSMPQSTSARINANGEQCIHKTVLHVIVNNGFYEASQNKPAIEMTHIWGNKCGFERGSDLAAGAGGMVQMAPMGRGPMHNLGIAMKKLACDIRSNGKCADVILVEPNFPRFLYIKCAHMGWHQMAKRNGLGIRDIKGIIKGEV